MADLLYPSGPLVSTLVVSPAGLSLGCSLPALTLAVPGALGFPDVQPRGMWRERDVRRAVAELLEATGAFEGLYTGPPERQGQRNDSRAVWVEPIASTERDSWDAAPTGRIDITSQLKITVLARDEIQQIRDDAAEYLLALVNNALNGTNLGGLTMPQFTRVQSWRWKDAAPPERRIEITFGFRYLLDTWNGFNESE